MQAKSIQLMAICLASAALMAHHHHTHRALGGENFGFNNNYAVNSQTQTGAAANSYGNGYSALSASKNAVATEAAGDKGANSQSAYQQKSEGWAVTNGFNNKDGYGNNNGSNNGFNNNFSNNINTQSTTGAIAYGAGGVKSNTGVEGGDVLAQGTQGTGSAMTWGQNQNAWTVSNGFGNKRLLSNKGKKESDSCEENFGWNNNWSDKSATNAAATSQSYGDGYSAVSAGRKGVNTEAYGKEGAKSSSAFEQQNNGWAVQNGFLNGKGGNTGFNNNFSNNNTTKAVTNAQGFGEAGVKSEADKDGANVFAKGTKGTVSDLGWKGAEDNWAVTNGFANKKRRLSAKGKNDDSCDGKSIDEIKKMVLAYKKQIVDLKSDKVRLVKQVEDLKCDNDELRKKCNIKGGKRLGVSQ